MKYHVVVETCEGAELSATFFTLIDHGWYLVLVSCFMVVAYLAAVEPLSAKLAFILECQFADTAVRCPVRYPLVSTLECLGAFCAGIDLKYDILFLAYYNHVTRILKRG